MNYIYFVTHDLNELTPFENFNLRSIYFRERLIKRIIDWFPVSDLKRHNIFADYVNYIDNYLNIFKIIKIIRNLIVFAFRVVFQKWIKIRCGTCRYYKKGLCGIDSINDFYSGTLSSDKCMDFSDAIAFREPTRFDISPPVFLNFERMNREESQNTREF